MREAQVDPIWTVHDCRGACGSKLYNLGFSMRRCLEFGRWATRKTFEDHYLKVVAYKERAEANKSLPSWEVLRMKTSLLNES